MSQAPDLHRLRRSVAFVGRLSDGVLRLGPLSIGLDGVLSWIPGVGEAYGAAAAVFMLVQGARGGVPVRSLTLCAALMFGRTLVAAIPVAGPVVADLFLAHRWSAGIIVRALDRRLAGQGAGRQSTTNRQNGSPAAAQWVSTARARGDTSSWKRRWKTAACQAQIG